MRPPRPANGAAQILQRGGDGIRRNTRRWLARPALSPVSTARTCSRVNASPAIYSIYRHKHRQCHLFAHRRPPLTAPCNAAGRAVSDRSRVGRFSSLPATGMSPRRTCVPHGRLLGVPGVATAPASASRASPRTGVVDEAPGQVPAKVFFGVRASSRTGSRSGSRSRPVQTLATVLGLAVGPRGRRSA
jgi:hypothetical protein